MLYDPAYARAAFAAPARVLGEAGLGAAEQALVLAVDRRAFQHDPLQRRRTLRPLLEEFKASTAIAVAETRSLAVLDGFFTGAAFHRAIAERGSLADALAEHLAGAGLRTPQLAGVIALERALARCRRELEAAGGVDYAPPPVPPGGIGRVVRAPGVDAVRVSPDALAAVQAVESFLFETSLTPVAWLADDRARLVLPPARGGGPAQLGLIPTSAGITLVELEPPVWDAIFAAAPPGVAIDRIGRALGESLVADEVLVPA
jgi:hypothetical protein